MCKLSDLFSKSIHVIHVQFGSSRFLIHFVCDTSSCSDLAGDYHGKVMQFSTIHTSFVHIHLQRVTTLYLSRAIKSINKDSSNSYPVGTTFIRIYH